MLKRLLTTVFVLLGSLSGTMFGTTQASAVLAAEANENSVWIDVRSVRDFSKGHLEGAINIPAGDIGRKIFLSVPDIFKEVHIYDGSQGTFANLALETLMEMGFQYVINEGGYEEMLAKEGVFQD